MTLLATIVATVALGTSSAAAPAAGGSQVVQGVVTAQFGFSLDADGRSPASASTIPVSITRTRENGVRVITIAPLR
jgi:hypothetical protein